MNNAVSFRHEQPELIAVLPVQTWYNFDDFLYKYSESEQEREEATQRLKDRCEIMMANIGFTDQNIQENKWKFVNPETKQTYVYLFDSNWDLKNLPDTMKQYIETADTYISGSVVIESFKDIMSSLKHFIGSTHCIYRPDEDDIENYGEHSLSSHFWENPQIFQSFLGYTESKRFKFWRTDYTPKYLQKNIKLRYFQSLQNFR